MLAHGYERRLALMSGPDHSVYYSSLVGKKRKQRRSTAGNHQRCWLWGRHAVMEALSAGQWLPERVLVAEELDCEERSRLEETAGDLNISIESETADRIAKLCGRTDHQGMAARMPEYPYASLEDMSQRLTQTPLLLVLDRIQDPFNFGAILRSAEVFGVGGVLVANEGQCEVTPHVARSSAGAVHHLLIARADRLTVALSEIRSQHGLKVVGATGYAKESVDQIDLTGPIAMVIGNEGEGISDELLAICDVTVRIPQTGKIESLNAAVAAGVLLYEVNRQCH